MGIEGEERMWFGDFMAAMTKEVGRIKGGGEERENGDVGGRFVVVALGSHGGKENMKRERENKGGKERIKKGG